VGLGGWLGIARPCNTHSQSCEAGPPRAAKVARLGRLPWAQVVVPPARVIRHKNLGGPVSPRTYTHTPHRRLLLIQRSRAASPCTQGHEGSVFTVRAAAVPAVRRTKEEWMYRIFTVVN
jgi:hypothetical protein